MAAVVKMSRPKNYTIAYQQLLENRSKDIGIKISIYFIWEINVMIALSRLLFGRVEIPEGEEFR